MLFSTDPSSMDDEIDLDELFPDITIPEPNMYIQNYENAISLIAELIRNKDGRISHARERIQERIDEIFSLFSDAPVENILVYYQQLRDLTSRLAAQQKIQKLQDKVVISFGGKFSAGKSAFINSISGLGDLLPVAQAPTTSIPTYIMKAKKDSLEAHSIYGYSTKLSAEAMNALTHEFYDVYSIGFSSFVDSIIAESQDFLLDGNIALLDTPGYTKYDGEKYSKLSISDRRRAFEQISISDYLIWLVDIENGGMTQDDISFIRSLQMKTPVLIVFTKADLKPESQIREIIDGAKMTISQTDIPCFGIAAYSSTKGVEYEGQLIRQFLEYTTKESVRNNDIMGEVRKIEENMRKSIQASIHQLRQTENALFLYIQNSMDPTKIRTTTSLWGKANQDSYRLKTLLRQFDDKVNQLNNELRKYLKGRVM